MQRASLESISNGPTPKARGKELPAPDDAVLRVRQLGNDSIHPSAPGLSLTRFTFCPSYGLNVNLVERADRRIVGHAGEADDRGRAGGALRVRSLCRDARKRGSSPPVPPLALIP